jgi:Mn-dependent DtxR family transcriptional regulator
MTKLQAQICGFVQSWIAKHGYPPTQAAIARELGVVPPTIRLNMKQLEARGLLHVEAEAETEIQAKILDHVRDFIAANGYSPSHAEIAEAVGTWVGTVTVNLNKLAARGRIIKGDGWRNLRLPDDGGSNARAAA